MWYSKLVYSVFVVLFVQINASEVKVGEFNNLQHGIGGTIYKIDDHTLLIKGFTYDGTGPDAFFMTGTKGKPSELSGTILPYPYENKFYEYADKSAPILQGQFNGNKDIELKTPSTIKTSDIVWLSVWCRAYKINFGEAFLKFPEKAESSDAESEPEIEPEPELDNVGEFKNLQHGIGGTIYKVDDNTLLIKEFTYDGKGPDAFFWAGTTGKPSASGGTIIPYPYENKFYDYTDKNAPILQGRFNGNKDIELKTPPTLKTTDIVWLSVWCRAYQVNFGEAFLKFSKGAEDGYAESESEPEGENSAISNHIDEGYETSQAKSVPEGEPETQPVRGSAKSNEISFVLAAWNVFVFSFLKLA